MLLTTFSECKQVGSISRRAIGGQGASASLQILTDKLTRQENDLLNDYSAKMALGLFDKTWWRFSSFSTVNRGR